jgi:hypothetical protein
LRESPPVKIVTWNVNGIEREAQLMELIDAKA